MAESTLSEKFVMSCEIENNGTFLGTWIKQAETLRLRHFQVLQSQGVSRNI